MGDTLCLVGSAVALGVGDGSAPSVVGAAVICPEDVLPSGSSVARSEDGPSVGSSESPQASSNGRRISARAKIPRKSRGILIWIHSLCLLGRGGTARRVRILAHVGGLPATAPGAVESMTRPVYQHGVRLESTGAGGCAVLRGSANGKRTPARGRGLSHSPADGGNYPSKVTLLPRSSAVPRRGPFCPPVTSGSQKTGCANRSLNVLRPFPVCESMPRTTWVQGLFPLRNRDKS